MPPAGAMPPGNEMEDDDLFKERRARRPVALGLDGSRVRLQIGLGGQVCRSVGGALRMVLPRGGAG